MKREGTATRIGGIVLTALMSLANGWAAYSVLGPQTFGERLIALVAAALTAIAFLVAGTAVVAINTIGSDGES